MNSSGKVNGNKSNKAAIILLGRMAGFIFIRQAPYKFVNIFFVTILTCR
jgi:hypothetical protein